VSSVTDVGLLTLAGAGVGPRLEHLELRGESPDFQCSSCCCSLFVFISPSAFTILLIFWVYVLLRYWVCDFQGGMLPESVCFALSVHVGVETEAAERDRAEGFF